MQHRRPVIFVALVLGMLIAAAFGIRMLSRPEPIATPERNPEPTLAYPRPSQATPQQSNDPKDRVQVDRDATAGGVVRGSASLLSVLNRTAPEGTRWSASKTEGADTVEFVVTATPVPLESGSWTLACLDADLAPLEHLTRVEAGKNAIIWVGPPGRLDLEVVDELGGPVSGAQVRWIPRFERRDSTGSPDLWRESDVRSTARTDQQGRVRLAQRAGGPGIVHVQAEGFLPAIRSLLGGGSLRIALRVPGELPPDLQVRDADSGAPVSGVRLWTREGPVTAASTPEGVLSFRAPVDAAQRLDVRGSGIAESRIDLNSIGRSALLVRGSTDARIEVLDGQGRPVEEALVLLFRSNRPGVGAVDAAEGVFGDVLLPSRATNEGGGLHLARRLPIGLPVQVLAIAGTRSATRTFVPAEESDPLRVSLHDGDFLDIVIPSSGGQDGSRVHGHVQYANYDRVPLRSLLREERVHVPQPERIRDILIAVDGHAPLELRPRSESLWSTRAGSTLEPLWVPSFRVAFRLRTDGDEPVVGADVRASWKHTNAVRYPDLHGFAPTGHPDWMQRVEVGVRGVSSALGIVEFELPEGEYTLFVGPDPRTAPPNHGFAYMRALTVRVTSNATQDLTLPGFARLSVVVVDENGLPPDRLEVRVEGGVAGATSRCVGNRWEGLVPTEARRLFVTAMPGRRSARVDLDALPDGEHELNIVLGERSGALVLSGEVEGLEGASVRIRARATRDENAPLVWEEDLRVDDPAWIPFDLPRGEPAFVQLTVQDQGSERWATEPEFVLWHPGAVLQFRLRRRGE